MIWFVLKTMFLAHAQIRLDIIFKMLHYQKAVKRRKNFDFVRNKSVAERPKSCEIVNSGQNFSHVFLYTRVVLKPAK